MHEAIAAGGGFTFGGAGAGAFLGVFAIGVHLRFGAMLGPFAHPARYIALRNLQDSNAISWHSLPFEVWLRSPSLTC